MTNCIIVHESTSSKAARTSRRRRICRLTYQVISTNCFYRPLTQGEAIRIGRLRRCGRTKIAAIRDHSSSFALLSRSVYIHAGTSAVEPSDKYGLSWPRNTGNTYLPFADLMKLEKIDQDTYRSVAKAFCPGGIHPRAHGVTYGGHVYAQAAWAAAQTVPTGFVLHSITGFFILGGLPLVPFVYKVDSVRNGRSYCTRTVNVTQAEGKGICFTCTCSFKIAERSDMEEQERVDLWNVYKDVLQDKRPEDFEEAPGMDVPWYWQLQKETGENDKFPGLQTTKVDMKAFNDGRSGTERRQLIFYRTIGAMSDDSNLHIAAHLYASDRNSLFIVANHFEVGGKYSQMGSLTHTVIFHSPIEQMMFPPPAKHSSPQGDWYCKEDWTTRIGSGRGMFHCRVLSPNGTHIATVMQDGMIRLDKKSASTSVKL
ncbi:hypothetical protein AMS68_001283 [Peltaster fructicola]|uniref:Acyl-CoA thioesterase II domain-containing protein n=1 Tax=Peltaster fructicola TaxID=286661 RepID=A0A6H0XM32_9PEZI|nr:hypothetical protein AMS68_001283 [Peltaster fructicola]